MLKYLPRFRQLNSEHLKKILIIVLTILFIINVPIAVYASTPEEDLAKVQKQLQDIQNKKKNIQNSLNSEKNNVNQIEAQLYTLKDQIDLLDTQIQEKELTIQELQLQIDILNQQIATNEQDIATAKLAISKLQDETDARLVDMYVSEKSSSQLNLVFESGDTDIIKLDLYRTSLQDDTNNLLDQLKTKKQELADQKSQLEDNRVAVERDETQIVEEKNSLEQDKTDLGQQQAIYYQKKNANLAQISQNQNQLNLVTEQEKLAAAEEQRLEQIVFDRVNSIPNGTYVSQGTIIGRQGCTGYCTGPHLHFGMKVNGNYVNPCSYLPSGVLAGCGTSSPSVSWPMRGSFVLTSGYGWRWGNFHYGIDIANYDQATPIYAAFSGYKYSGFEPCSGGICKNGGANYIIICENRNCNVGKKSLYWHLRDKS